MRVLVASKFWYRRGGLERVMFDETAWLESAGHTVAHFATTHPANEQSPWSSYFTPYLELGRDSGLSSREKVRAAVHMFSNREAARRFQQLVDDFGPDVVHLHGIHRQISPSILAPAIRRGVPVVQTLHDFHHICPADTLMHSGVEPCQPRRCSTVWYGSCLAGRCVRGSLPASTLSAAETAWQRGRRVYERNVARSISPSRFLASQMQAAGWTVPIDVVPNAIAVCPPTPVQRSGFCIVGRLSPEKGVAHALEAARTAGVPLTVAGEGPSGSALASQYPEFDFVGRLDGTEVAALMQRSLAVLVPSVCLENAPMSVLEAMASGTLVVASAVGGIPEQVTEGVDGLLVPPGDAAALCSALRSLVEQPDLARHLGVAARRTVEERFSPEGHLEGLLAVYRAAGGPQ
jgi:glycosyltransferase involved in cell wall biosynthesis